MRAEDLLADLGCVDLVTFAQSFHWMERLKVARVVPGMLLPGGSCVHVHATTHRGDSSVDPLPRPRPPYEKIDARAAPHYRTAPQETCPRSFVSRGLLDWLVSRWHAGRWSNDRSTMSSRRRSRCQARRRTCSDSVAQSSKPNSGNSFRRHQTTASSVSASVTSPSTCGGRAQIPASPAARVASGLSPRPSALTGAKAVALLGNGSFGASSRRNHSALAERARPVVVFQLTGWCCWVPTWDGGRSGSASAKRWR